MNHLRIFGRAPCPATKSSQKVTNARIVRFQGIGFRFTPDGIVNLTRVWQTGPHENANTQLPTSPFSHMVKILIPPCGI